METVKVKLVYTEDDSYNELWREVSGKRRYFARHVYGKPIWYHVCDPLGYRELDYPCKNIVFAVCNANGRVLFQDSNLQEYSNPFPTLHQAAQAAWEEVERPVTTNLQNWLLSYMTPENLAKDPDNTQFCPDENWKYCWYDRVEHRIHHKFQYLGATYAIWAITCKHRYCDCQWVEYMAGDIDMDWEYPSFIAHFGDEFTPVFGPMYSKYEAISRVADMLNEIYGCKTLSTVYEGWGGMHERRYSTREAAEMLVGTNLHRARIDAIVEAQGVCGVHFYTSRQALLEAYPDCRLSMEFPRG